MHITCYVLFLKQMKTWEWHTTKPFIRLPKIINFSHLKYFYSILPLSGREKPSEEEMIDIMIKHSQNVFLICDC